MAVTITENRTLVDEADSTTGWSSPFAGEGLAVFTADPDPVESTGSLGMAVSNETSDIVHTITSVDLSDTLVYVWILANGTMDTTINGGIAIILGDGTNEIGYHLAGSDVAAFRHEDGPVGWQCLLLDTNSRPTDFTALQGTEASLSITAITQIGAQFKTLSKALGGTENCFTDIIRYGNSGITITTGTSTDPGTFAEIAIEDRSTNTGTAYGILRELGTGLFGCQGPLTFGDTAGTAATFFKDTNVTVAFEDRGIGTNKYSVTVQGNATGSTTFELGTRDGVGLGSDGCTLLVPTGVGASFTANDADLQFMNLYGSTLSGFNTSVSLSTDATNGPNHEIFASNFIGCGQITIGQTEFKNNSISGSVATGTAEGAVLIEDTTNITDLSFTSGGTGHAIEIADSTNSPFTFTNFTYEGYAATDGGTGNEVLVNTSGNPITINVTGGDTPTVDTTNSTGTVTINNNVSVTITVQDEATNPIQNAVVAAYDVGTDTEILNDETDVNGEVTASVAANNDIYIRVRKSTTGSTRYFPVETVANTSSGLALTVTMTEDNIASP